MAGSEQASWLIRTADNLFIGPTVAFDYVWGHDMDRPELIEGQRSVSVQLRCRTDSALRHARQSHSAARRRIPSGAAVVPPQVHGQQARILYNRFAHGRLSAHVEGSHSCRRPAHTVQLRQPTVVDACTPWRQLFHARILSRQIPRQAQSGGADRAATARMATQRHRTMGRSRHSIPQVQPDKDEPYTAQHGIGYRWEFKKNVNVRLDYGLGKSGQSGFIFNINEAF